MSTAEEFRARKILVKDGDLTIACRRPDPLTLIADDVLPLPLFADVLENLTATMQTAFDDRVSTEARAKPSDPMVQRFLDRWVCAAAVMPHVVLTEDEALADADALWVQDIDPSVRWAILQRTSSAFASPRLRAAVLEFRRQQSAGAAVGSNGAAVREDAIPALAGA